MSDELIKVTTNERGQKLVSARELHEVLEISTQFTIWIKRMIGYGFEENIDYTLVIQKRLTNNPKNPYTEETDYVLTLDMGKHIAMIQRSDIGMKVRNYFIECEKQLSIQLQMDSYMIVDPVKRAERWIEEEKERQRLEQENKYLVQDNKHKEEVIQGITETLDKPTLRSRINQIVKYGAKSGYQGRYRLLYSEFEKTHRMNLKLRLAKAIDNGTLKKSANRMDLICDHLDMTQELYEAAIRVFEGDFYKLGLDIVEYVKRGQQEYLSLECK